MANVKFLRGLKANLPSSFTAADEGSFYLTTDSKQLFNVVQTGTNTYGLIPLGENITQFESAATAGAAADFAGQFAYIKNGNILMVSIPDATLGAKWVQVNSQSPKVARNELSAIEESNSVKVKSSIFNSDGDEFPAEMGVSGTGSVTVSVDTDGGLVINVPVYTLAGSAITNGVQLAVGAGEVSIGGDNETIRGTYDAANKKLTLNANTIDKVEGFHGSVATAASASGTEGFRIKVSDDFGHYEEGYLNPIVKTLDGNDAGVKFIDGVATLNTYSKAQIDALKIQADAMHFKGTLGSSGSISTFPTTNVEIGDTYKVVSEFTSPVKVKKGDLVIANGTEDASGHITPATLTWDVVPAGDDVDDYNLAFTSGSHKIELLRAGSGTGSLALAAANAKITLADSGDAVDGVVTIGHGAIGATDSGVTASVTKTRTDSTATPGADFDIEFVGGVEIDATGHVSGVQPKKISVKGNKLASGSDEITVTAAGSAVTIGGTATLRDDWSVTDTAGEQGEGNHSLSVSSSTLAVSASVASNVGTYNIDMVWGTFGPQD